MVVQIALQILLSLIYSTAEACVVCWPRHFRRTLSSRCNYIIFRHVAAASATAAALLHDSADDHNILLLRVGVALTPWPWHSDGSPGLHASCERRKQRFVWISSRAGDATNWGPDSMHGLLPCYGYYPLLLNSDKSNISTNIYSTLRAHWVRLTSQVTWRATESKVMHSAVCLITSYNPNRRSIIVEQMTLQKGSKNGDTLHGGITRQNWYHFVQHYLKFMKLDMWHPKKCAKMSYYPLFAVYQNCAKRHWKFSRSMHNGR